MKRFSGILTILISVALLLTSCGNEKEMERLANANEQLKKENQKLRDDLQKVQSVSNRLDFLAEKLKGIKARIVTNYGNIELEFFPEKAPITVYSFISRAESGFYDNTQFHRVIKDFMIQAGDPNSKDNIPENDGQGGPIVNIPHEFNDIKHEPGIISMARISDVSAGAGSQFFIMHSAKPYLDNQYTAFGKVTDGMEVVDKIANVKTYQNDPRLRDHPVKPVVIKKVEVYR